MTEWTSVQLTASLGVGEEVEVHWHMHHCGLPKLNRPKSADMLQLLEAMQERIAEELMRWDIGEQAEELGLRILAERDAQSADADAAEDQEVTRA